MKLDELRKKTKEELNEELSKSQKSLRDVVADVLQKKEKNVKKAKQIRKEIARIKTLLKELN